VYLLLKGFSVSPAGQRRPVDAICERLKALPKRVRQSTRASACESLNAPAIYYPDGHSNEYSGSQYEKHLLINIDHHGADWINGRGRE
jgi:hypothetical protein